MRAQSGNFFPLGMWGRVALAVSRSILQSSLQPNVSPRASTPNSVVSSFFSMFLRREEDWKAFFQKMLVFKKMIVFFVRRCVWRLFFISDLQARIVFDWLHFNGCWELLADVNFYTQALLQLDCTS